MKVACALSRNLHDENEANSVVYLLKMARTACLLAACALLCATTAEASHSKYATLLTGTHRDPAANAFPAAPYKAGQTLAPRAFNMLKTGAITPKGWLLKQLKLQAQGLSGHLSQFWNDIMNSVWVGGGGDGGLHERTPYWLNGIVPLAHLLKNAGVETLPGAKGIYMHAVEEHGGHAALCAEGLDMRNNDVAPAGPSGTHAASAQACHDLCNSTAACVAFVYDDCAGLAGGTCWLKGAVGETSSAKCRCFGKLSSPPVPPVDVLAQAHRYVDAIIGYVQPDGWIGPPQVSGTDYWGRSNVVLALEQYAEAEPERGANVSTILLNYLLAQKARMVAKPMTSWAAQRWQDMALGLEWVYENAPADLLAQHAEELWALGAEMQQQGVDWEGWFENFNTDAGPHNVNNAQGLKSAAVWYRFAKNETLHELSRRRMENMDARYGLPSGVFNGDELLPAPATRDPSRGFELCGVVEAMFSYNTMFSVHGDVSFADRAERIAYNALPATWASPEGGDMWAHQYLQAVNEIMAVKSDPHVWQHDGDEAETYGLEPNFGCCTANFNQGWPKFANMLVYTTADHGAAVAIYAPASAQLPANVGGGGVVDLETSYPFDDTATVTVTNKDSAPMPVYLRIPEWATKATVNGAAAANGTMFKTAAKANADTKFVIAFNPEIRVERWGDLAAGTAANPEGAVSVHRGALMYSLNIETNWSTTATHFDAGADGMSKDYEARGVSEWNYAIDVQDLSKLTFGMDGYKAGAAPFNHSNWPVHIDATVRQVPTWGTGDLKDINSAEPPPASPACKGSTTCGAPTKVRLVPFGGTDLRIGEMPASGF